MNGSERFSAILSGRKPDRLPVIEWAPWWNLTVRRWENEGLKTKPRTYRDVYGIQRELGLDGCVQTFYNVRTKLTPKAVSRGQGIIKNEDDYRKIKQTMYPEPEDLFPREHYLWLESVHADGESIAFFSVEGFFWFARELLGIEPHFYSFYDCPELLDAMSFAEDMSYNNGPMLGKELFDRFLAPYYKRIIPVLKKYGVPVFIDSDGDITKAVDWYSEAGADGMFPLERQAGVDVSVYIAKHPEMAFLGHFDKMCMKYGENAMRAEFERLMPSWQNGKLIPSVDHQTPPDVSLDNYKIFVSLFKEYSLKV